MNAPTKGLQEKFRTDDVPDGIICHGRIRRRTWARGGRGSGGSRRIRGRSIRDAGCVGIGIRLRIFQVVRVCVWAQVEVGRPRALDGPRAGAERGDDGGGGDKHRHAVRGGRRDRLKRQAAVVVGPEKKAAGVAAEEVVVVVMVVVVVVVMKTPRYAPRRSLCSAFPTAAGPAWVVSKY